MRSPPDKSIIPRMCNALTLKVQSFESREDGYLLQLKANPFVSAQLVAERIKQLYPEMLRRLNARRLEIFRPLNIRGQLNNSAPRSAFAPQPPPWPPSPEQPTSGKRQQVYQEIVPQIQYKPGDFNQRWGAFRALESTVELVFVRPLERTLLLARQLIKPR